MSVAPRRRSTTPRAIFALLLLAPVAFGIGAALLVGPLPSAPLQVAPKPAMVTLEVIGLVIAGFFLLLIAALLIPLIGGRRGLGSGFVTLALVYLLVGVLIVIALHLVAPAGLAGTGTGPNGTKPPPPPPGSSGNASVGFPGGILLPSWVLYVIVGVVAVLAGAVAVPFAIGRREARMAPPRGPEPSRGRSAITDALSELDDDSLVPRERIIRVYQRLLRRVGPRAGDLDRMTAREIETSCRVSLGIGAQAAHELTSLFEEARYSDHEIDGAMVGRARAALEVALADLDRRRAGPRT
ncbi:MAG: DUF4129 domain-containing protein [Thermoplasmata archaeon]|nr:DUF4129 domain-containing protein [Thermoplasmata archaeon]